MRLSPRSVPATPSWASQHPGLREGESASGTHCSGGQRPCCLSSWACSGQPPMNSIPVSLLSPSPLCFSPAFPFLHCSMNTLMNEIQQETPAVSQESQRWASGTVCPFTAPWWPPAGPGHRTPLPAHTTQVLPRSLISPQSSVHGPMLTRSLPPSPMALMDFDPRLQCCVWNRARLSQGVPSCAE